MKKVFFLAFVLIFVPFISYAQNGDIDPNQNQCLELKNNLRLRARDIETNGEVSLLQDFLQEKGLFNGEPTGFFGQMTLRAVQSYQRAQGLIPSGFVGDLTRGKIKLGSGCNGTTPSPVYQAGCTSTQGFSSVTGNACNGTTPPPTYLPGCTSTQSFSSVNGNACNGTTPSPVYQAGCTSTQSFSSVTGNACDGSTGTGTYPAGCSSFQGFSSVNGSACSRMPSIDFVEAPGFSRNEVNRGVRATVRGTNFLNSNSQESLVIVIAGTKVQLTNITSTAGDFFIPLTTPLGMQKLYVANGSNGDSNVIQVNVYTGSGTSGPAVQVVSPNGGETYSKRDLTQMPIQWKADCGFESFSAYIVREYDGIYATYVINNSIPQGICTPGQLGIPYFTTWTIPYEVKPGSYRLALSGFKQGTPPSPSVPWNVVDSSDMYFKIIE